MIEIKYKTAIGQSISRYLWAQIYITVVTNLGQI